MISGSILRLVREGQIYPIRKLNLTLFKLKHACAQTYSHAYTLPASQPKLYTNTIPCERRLPGCSVFHLTACKSLRADVIKVS